MSSNQEDTSAAAPFSVSSVDSVDEVPEEPIDFKDLHFQASAGVGALGEVFHATYNKRDVAVKRWLYAPNTTAFQSMFQKECLATKICNHPNIVRYVGYCDDPLCVITEWSNGRNLRNMIQTDHHLFSWRQVLEIARQTCLALDHIHSKKIVHRDLKCNNILVEMTSDQMHVKVCDFGMAKSMNNCGTVTQSRGTAEYMAPELVTDASNLTTQSDMYSFSMILWELCTGRAPFENEKNSAALLFKVVTQHYRPSVPSYIPTFIAKIIVACWDQQPERRPTPSALASMFSMQSLSEHIPADVLDSSGFNIMSSTGFQQLVGHWKTTCASLKVASNLADSYWTIIATRYSEPQRHYHTLNHLAEMFQHYESLEQEVKLHDAVKCSIFFHDVIYEVESERYGDNEKLSADLFEKFAQEGQLSSSFSRMVSDWILATKNHQLPSSCDESEDLKLFLDMDMAVLGRDLAGYANYASQIRNEFSYVPFEAYCAGRAQVLQSFLHTPRIFHSQHFYQQREQLARQNVQKEIDALLEGKLLEQVMASSL